jgi:hypothetical protein
MTRRRYAALAILLGAIGVSGGSVTTWGTCSSACRPGGGGFMALVPRDGVSWGPGVLTFALGLLLAAIAIHVLRGGTSSIAWRVSLGASLGALGGTLAWVFRMFVVPEFSSGGPGLGVYLVVLGATIAAIASPALRLRPNPSH